METYFGEFRWGNLLFQRSLAGIYAIAFIAALNQFPALVGENGLLPATTFLRRVSFVNAPSVFQIFYSDRFFAFTAWIGILLSSLVIFGVVGNGPWYLITGVWLALYFLYLSIVNVGQTFYAFGWETMLLEAGFFAAFLGPAARQPSLIPVLALRWMLFRLILGAGLIKLRNDTCWRDLSCLAYHFETQPMPNPLSWYFHYLPVAVLKSGVLLNHFVEVIAPFGLLGPQPVAAAAGGVVVLHQLLLILSGNFSFLNFLTIVLSLTAVSDAMSKWIVPARLPAALPPAGVCQPVLAGLAVATVLLSIQPVRNLISPHQIMNTSYNPLQLVNSYGMFGDITRTRYEIIIEGTDESRIGSATKWRAYEFKGKPGDVTRPPPQVAPYHLRLDWLMWFLPFTVDVRANGLLVDGYEFWFLRFMEKLLQGDPPTLRLLRTAPFPAHPPTFVRARFYRYRFTTGPERTRTGAWWRRDLVGDYLPPVDLAALHALGVDAGELAP